MIHARALSGSMADGIGQKHRLAGNVQSDDPTSVLLADRILIARSFCRNHAHKVTLQPIEKSPWVICGLHLQELTVHQRALRFTAPTTTSPHLISNWAGSSNLSHITKPIIIAVSLSTCATPNHLPPSSPTSSTYNKHSLDFHTIPAYTQPQQLTARAPSPNPTLNPHKPYRQNDIRQRPLHFVHLPWQLCHAAHRPLPLPRGQR